ncbi:MAG: cytochrome c3 family protein, partial [Nitrospirota bacterium]
MKRILTFLIVLTCSVIIIINGFPGGVGAAQTESLDESGTCITAQCHSNINKTQFVHGPVAAGQCRVCHGEASKHPGDPKQYRFPTIVDINTTCFSCHEKFPQKKFIHSAVDSGGCTSCHGPHGSPYKFQLLYQGGELCFQCHDEALTGEQFVHGPAAVGGCITCHDPHTADYAMNLKAEGPALCFSCHTDKADTIGKSEFVHKPVSENCTQCHNPHSAPRQFMLQSTAPDLCYTCHNDKKEQISTASAKHGAVTAERSCLNCHDPHSSGIARILLMEPMDLCLHCHDRQYTMADGSMLINMKQWLENNSDWHGPIRQKDCSGCHNPHGSNVFRILRYTYPPTFYMPFSVENYSLCFSCHEKTIV